MEVQCCENDAYWRKRYQELCYEMGEIVNEQISESTYYQNMSHWNRVAQNYRALGGLGICDDETGEEIYTV